MAADREYGLCNIGMLEKDVEGEMNKETRSKKAAAERVHNDREARGTETAVLVRVRSFLSFVQPLNKKQYDT